VAAGGFALNHMAAPGLRPDGFLALAARLGVTGVEIRNDLAGNAILDGTPAAEMRALAARHGLRILSLNALQRFNDWSETRAGEAAALADYAAEAGAAALVLVPTNDGTGLDPAERRAKLAEALDALAPILARRGILGLVEPLGFATCSLRLKSEAAAAIGACGTGAPFRLVHDSFHHALAGEARIFPDLTGLVHVSGVTDPRLAPDAMRDPHRVLVDAADRLGTVTQIVALRAAGVTAPLSFEPFAPGVHADPDLEGALARSIAFIRTAVRAGGQEA
jgi:2-keto-myo-inositol isomerase